MKEQILETKNGNIKYIPGEDAIDLLERVAKGDQKLAAEAFWIESSDGSPVELKTMIEYILTKLSNQKTLKSSKPSKYQKEDSSLRVRKKMVLKALKNLENLYG